MGVNLARADDEEEQEAATGRLGLVWDPEEGPVWRDIGGAEEQKLEDTWTQLLNKGVSGITTDSDGSIYLFKGDSYWKFMFPGSLLQDGYPRSSAADWLDCTDSSSSSSSPVVDDLSLSLSRRRQELRERWREDREEEEAAGKMRDNGRYRYVNSHKDIQDRGSHIWTQCTCKNGALCSRITSYISTLLLIIWTLLAL